MMVIRPGVLPPHSFFTLNTWPAAIVRRSAQTSSPVLNRRHRVPPASTSPTMRPSIVENRGLMLAGERPCCFVLWYRTSAVGLAPGV
jgi:hypothetical protein